MRMFAEIAVGEHGTGNRGPTKYGKPNITSAPLHHQRQQNKDVPTPFR